MDRKQKIWSICSRIQTQEPLTKTKLWCTLPTGTAHIFYSATWVLNFHSLNVIPCSPSAMTCRYLLEFLSCFKSKPHPNRLFLKYFVWLDWFSIDWPFTFLLALIFFFFFFYKSKKLGMTSLNSKVLIPRFKRGRLTISLSKLLTLNKKVVFSQSCPLFDFSWSFFTSCWSSKVPVFSLSLSLSSLEKANIISLQNKSQPSYWIFPHGSNSWALHRHGLIQPGFQPARSLNNFADGWWWLHQAAPLQLLLVRMLLLTA